MTSSATQRVVNCDQTVERRDANHRIPKSRNLKSVSKKKNESRIYNIVTDVASQLKNGGQCQQDERYDDSLKGGGGNSKDEKPVGIARMLLTRRTLPHNIFTITGITAQPCSNFVQPCCTFACIGFCTSDAVVLQAFDSALELPEV